MSIEEEPSIGRSTALVLPNRAAHQPPQALQAGCDPLREASGELQGNADARRDQDLAMICKQTLVGAGAPLGL
jgi:hypothetical protein